MIIGKLESCKIIEYNKIDFPRVILFKTENRPPVAVELFKQFSGPITITTEGTESQDTWGEFSYSGGVATATTAIIDTYNEFSRQFTNGAAVTGGDIVFIIIGTQTLNDSDTITYNGQDFRIIMINPIPVEGTNIVFLVPAALK